MIKETNTTPAPFLKELDKQCSVLGIQYSERKNG
jgi:hypothetical protein